MNIRKLLIIVAIAAPGSLWAQAPSEVEVVHEEDPAPLEVGASFFSRYELRDGYDRLGISGGRFGESDRTAYRARLSLATAPHDVGRGRSVRLLFAPQASGYWGDPSGGLDEANLGLYEAKMRLSTARTWFDIGRFQMSYGEHLVIGNVDWHETGRAFDGMRFHGELGSPGAYVDLFATFLAEGSQIGATEPAAAGDFYFLGVYAGIGPLLHESVDLDLYLLANIAPMTEDGPTPQDFTATEVTLGARAQKRLDRATFRMETGLQIGERPGSRADVLAYHLDADVMVAVHDRVQLGAAGTYASGDDPDTRDLEGWNQLYPTAHKFLGLMDIMGGRSNVGAAGWKARARAEHDIDLGLDGHFFFRPETLDGVDAYTGFEADGWIAHKLGEGLALRGQYSMFVPNVAGPLVEDELAHYLELQLSYRR